MQNINGIYIYIYLYIYIYIPFIGIYPLHDFSSKTPLVYSATKPSIIPNGGTLKVLKPLCSENTFWKSKRFELKNSILMSTQVSLKSKSILGEFRGARIHEQHILWGRGSGLSISTPFDISSLRASCTCRFATKADSKGYCSHIIGQMRRVIFMTQTPQAEQKEE